MWGSEREVDIENTTRQTEREMDISRELGVGFGAD